MKTATFPRIESVSPLPDQKLLVCFAGGKKKIYDCRSLLKKEPFSALQNESFFRQVRVDAGGYGISWNDQMDLSESELWLNGKTTKHTMGG
jgi:hypothetical protein